MSISADQVPTLVERMIRIEAKLDTYNQNHQDHEGRIRLLENAIPQGGHQDHETRIRAVERRMWVIAGASLVGGGIITAVINQLVAT